MKRMTAVLLVVLFNALAGPAAIEAQVWKKAKKTVEKAAEDEALKALDNAVRDGVRCVFDDLDCIEKAEKSGEPVVLTDDQGNVITDDEGQPITDPDKAADKAEVKPGEGVWSNYDFVAGDDVLFYEDYGKDNIGDFPRRLEFVRGNWEIVEWQGQRLLRNTGPRYATFKIVLSESLPEQFTIEFDAHFPHGNQRMGISTEPLPKAGMNHQPGNYFQVGQLGTGVVAGQEAEVEALKSTEGSIDEQLTPIRIMVDGRYAKVYVGERRVANVPNAQLNRSNEISFVNTYFADDENPMYLGSIRVAGGGKDLYDVLEAEGRVTTRGILFATNSDRIRPESTPTLKEIGEMLTDHADLWLSIEGHTDSDGDETYNQELSQRRAAAVKAYLVESFAIEENRLETAGFGESNPVADNSIPEGKQQNRRVELVKLDAASS
jgi:outer membrane protein OmpA-like peptidoglycan-associated protein